MEPETSFDLKPGSETSENAIAKIAQYTGGGLFGAALTASPFLPPIVAATALICAALIMVVPSLYYIASRKAIKCEACRGMMEAHKTKIAKQAAPGTDTDRTA